MYVCVGVMASKLALWDGGSQIDTWSGTFSGNHYLNGLRHTRIYATWWMKLASDVALFAADLHVYAPQ